MSSNIAQATMQTAVEARLSPARVSVMLRSIACDSGDSECMEHCNIEAYVADVKSGDSESMIGRLKLFRLNKAAMERVGPAEMWQQCQVYDRMHFGGKLNKIEIFLENECFFEERHIAMAEAEVVVYIEEVVLDKKARGQGLGLEALSQAIVQMRLPRKTILMLEPGGIGELECGHEEAGEKLAKHWSKLGFRLWSYTDEAWLCLDLKELIMPAGRDK